MIEWRDWNKKIVELLLSLIFIIALLFFAVLILDTADGRDVGEDNSKQSDIVVIDRNYENQGGRDCYLTSYPYKDYDRGYLSDSRDKLNYIYIE